MASKENSPMPSTENKQFQSMDEEEGSEKDQETHYGSYESGNDGESRQEMEDYSDTRGCNKSSENVERTTRKAFRPPKCRKANTPPIIIRKRKAKMPPAKKIKHKRTEISSSSSSSSSSNSDSESS